ncbi:MAG: hypothetical protein KDJ15_04520 [Alphaproteobacteria bacterium]|nr:hypothetical protein [Alphaproteobacteria bacterium]
MSKNILQALLATQDTTVEGLRELLSSDNQYIQHEEHAEKLDQNSDKNIIQSLLFGDDSSLRLSALSDALLAHRENRPSLALPFMVETVVVGLGKKAYRPSPEASLRILYRSWLKQELPHQITEGPVKELPKGTTFEQHLKDLCKRAEKEKKGMNTIDLSHVRDRHYPGC